MKQPNLSIILPVHNEVGSLESVISEWDASLREIPDLHHIFILCEDGSIDGTKDLIIELGDRYPILNNSVSARRGYGQAVRDGIALAQTPFILCIDSDGQLGPEAISAVWPHRSEAHFVMGWRYRRLDPPIRLIYSKMFKLYHRSLFQTTLHDPSCPFVFGHKNLFKQVVPLLIYMREGFWWGFVGACCKMNIPIEEIKINHRSRVAGNTQVYKLAKMPGIILRNCVGLLKLRFA